MTVEDEIAKIVNRETHAWDTQDLDLLLSVFHPDMVWPWPPTAQSHDPIEWVMPMGRFNRERWGKAWSELFAANQLVHNHRIVRRIQVSAEGDGAFAVVDIDTLWRNRQSGSDQNWNGRTCKAYAKIGQEWKMTMQTGVLNYATELTDLPGSS